jgi:hypothetical protein
MIIKGHTKNGLVDVEYVTEKEKTISNINKSKDITEVIDEIRKYLGLV